MNSIFKEKFIEIHNKKWIKGVTNNMNSVGLTFESLLGKDADSMYFPDYYGIEIKTTTRFSGYPIGLFNLTFDGPNLYETNRILQTYGKRDIVYKDKKILIGKINSIIPTKIYKNSFKLDIDREEKKLYLCIYDKNDNLIERKSYIEFDTINQRINLKLKHMAIVYASKMKVNNDLYYRYYSYKLYKLRKDIDFFDLINNDTIKVEIVCRVSRSSIEAGRQRNKAIVFKLAKDSINNMFECIEEYNADNQ